MTHSPLAKMAATLLALACLTGTGTAQEPVKIATVDLLKAFDSYWKTKLSNDQLKERGADFDKARVGMTDAFRGGAEFRWDRPFITFAPIRYYAEAHSSGLFWQIFGALRQTLIARPAAIAPGGREFTLFDVFQHERLGDEIRSHRGGHEQKDRNQQLVKTDLALHHREVEHRSDQRAACTSTKGIVTLTRVRWQRWIFFVVATHEYDCQLQAPPFSARDHHARGLALCAFQPLPTRGRGNAPEPWRRRFL